MDWYVYYQVRDADAAALLPAVRAMQTALGAAHGLTPQLKKRPPAAAGAPKGLQTWMEIYPAAPDGFEAVLDAAVRHANLAPLIAGLRHPEVFTDFLPCV